MTRRDSTSRKTRKSPPTNRERDSTPTGAGSEAAAGIQGVRKATRRSSGRGSDRAGSEPLVGRDVVHKSGYGGEGGRPRISSDHRENAARNEPAPRK